MSLGEGWPVRPIANIQQNPYRPTQVRVLETPKAVKVLRQFGTICAEMKRRKSPESTIAGYSLSYPWCAAGQRASCILLSSSEPHFDKELQPRTLTKGNQWKQEAVRVGISYRRSARPGSFEVLGPADLALPGRAISNKVGSFPKRSGTCQTNGVPAIGGTMYSQRFDVFRKESDGVLWVGSAETMQAARMTISGRSESPDDEFIVLNQATGEKITILASSERP
jgi:hypothetical protein